MNHLAPAYPIDNSAILYLAQMGPDHTNVYRFTAALQEPIDPELLQKAADRIYLRFPTIFAGFCPGSFSYKMVPARQAPQVRQDPGFLLVMTQEEIQSCAYRIYYSGRQVIIEAFHALTDGYGAIASLKALLGEYVYLKYGISVPERENFLQAPPVWEEELRDVYPDHCAEKPGFLPRQTSYQLPGQDGDKRVRAFVRKIPTQSLRDAAKRHGVSITSLVSALMAEAIMELQHRTGSKKKPVRIMVPVDLRNPFPCKTLRNFILYALPTLAVEESGLSRKERFRRFQSQLRSQTDKSLLKAQITRNVKIQANLLFRILPLGLKCALMRLSYRFFGEVNSSITLTNLGPVALSEALQSQVSWIEVHLMPRRTSPYNCALLSCGETTRISITSMVSHEVLETLFFAKLHEVLSHV